MPNFLGEYPVSMDDKGRVKLPAALKRQLEPASGGRFVINRGFEKCLVLYPFNEWEKINSRLTSLNLFEKKNRQFVRFFLRGATELTLDAADRLNIPNHLSEYADISKNLMLSARNNVIEVWNPKHYDALLSMDSDEFAKLAEEVMGDKDNPDEQ